MGSYQNFTIDCISPVSGSTSQFDVYFLLKSTLKTTYAVDCYYNVNNDKFVNGVLPSGISSFNYSSPKSDFYIKHTYTAVNGQLNINAKLYIQNKNGTFYYENDSGNFNWGVCKTFLTSTIGNCTRKVNFTSTQSESQISPCTNNPSPYIPPTPQTDSNSNYGWMILLLFLVVIVILAIFYYRNKNENLNQTQQKSPRNTKY